MKVTKLEAQGVHGYLQFSICFFDDLTFLVGLNGSGKTSALRLLMALLTPNLEELTTTAFATVSTTVTNDGRELVIRATRLSDGIQLEVTGLDEVLVVTSAELQLLTETRRGHEESKPPVLEKMTNHPVFRAIAEMSTPMFLGLDRRFSRGTLSEDPDEVRRREFLTRRLYGADPAFRGLQAAGLADVNVLVANRMHEIRAAQEQLDDDLRNKILARAFEYKPAGDTLAGNAFTPPSWNELERYKQRLAAIERAAENLRLPVPELKATLTDFFERMTAVVASLTQMAGSKQKQPPSEQLLDWIINKPQAERILEHLGLLDKYSSQREDLHSPIIRCLTLVNSFLKQTKKRVSVSMRGELSVNVDGDDTPRATTSLSSGERQMLVMLAHLSLNKDLAKSGVFIVDEPELSLHIDWQERFVAAVHEANPTVQLIMATHSPAIILNRDDRCSSLSC